jgi:beta-mannosidase
MACQAEGLKHGVEHYRRRQPVCNGTLVWQLNDSWPGLSWSVLDFDLVPKAGYWFLQRAYQPLLASFRVEEGRLELWVSNSGLETVSLSLAVTVGPLCGPAPVYEVDVTSAGYSSVLVWTGMLASDDQVAWVVEREGRAPANRRFLRHLKELPLRESSLSATLERTGPTSGRVTMTADGYAYFARVLCDRPGARFSTNYLDVRDGETVSIDVTGIPAGATLSFGSYGTDPAPL